MPIEVLTGQPGNGKTALMMERLLEAVEKGERPVYAAGIDGLNVPGVHVLDDAKRWNAKNDDGTFVVPDGAIVFVDEAWKDFGHLHAETRGPTPLHVLALAEHRHRGLDFVWTTQQPNQLYPFVRGLIGGHSHVVRRFGTHFLDVYTWGELNDDVKSAGKRENAIRVTRKLPQKSFDKYKSATLHTIKRRIPLRVWVIPIAVIGALIAGYLAMRSLRPEAMSAKLKGTNPDAALAASDHPASGGDKSAAPRYKTAQEYATAATPRIAELPWTAPLFDGRAVVSEPRVFCTYAAAGEGANGEQLPDSCHCLTEQGTLYALQFAKCRALAFNGEPYNPFRQPQREGRRFGDDDSKQTGPVRAAPAPEAVRGAGSVRELQAPYGAFRG